MQFHHTKAAVDSLVSHCLRKNVPQTERATPPQLHLQLNPGVQFHSKPALMTSAVGITCTKEWAFDWRGERMESCLQG
ncbi:hypothetical protein Pyn_30421 [Prunus yedoensis var. nudiflora]|uniref:Uncharacterized protein n=1 Tax=Prunus yedoensis var. nudiflora TaxID=2094558 RepID=A0A314ZLW9_PRUYE|nr:hypothetical protein Pyn_30421 [Prunus yedoensis var. nudiflora]